MLTSGQIRKERMSNACGWLAGLLPLLLLNLFQGPSPWNGAAHIPGGSSHLHLTSLEMPSEPQRCVFWVSRHPVRLIWKINHDTEQLNRNNRHESEITCLDSLRPIFCKCFKILFPASQKTQGKVACYQSYRLSSSPRTLTVEGET